MMMEASHRRISDVDTTHRISLIGVSEMRVNLSSVPYFDGIIIGSQSEKNYTVSIHADMIKIKTNNPPPPPDSGKTRGNVSSFSRKSRKRMIEILADEIRVPDLFVTLTFSDDTYSPCMDVYKSHLEAFRRRLERAYGDISAIWRLEVEKRKSGDYKGFYMPHYHLLIWLPDDHKNNRDLIVDKDDNHHWSKWWYDITGSINSEHLRARGCDIQVIKSRRHGYHYVSKYASKDSEDNLEIGRRWGRFGTVGQGSRADIIISYETYIELKRLITSYHKRMKKVKSKKTGEYVDFRNKKLARSLSRQSPKLGLTGFGLGVWDAPDYQIDKTTIFKMICHAKEISEMKRDYHE
jgi:hypothetical protein